MIDVTDDVQQAVRSMGITDGACLVYVPHTTAAVTINESADPSVREDILMVLNQVVPWKAPYKHLEGNSPAHLKTSLIGSSELVAVENERLVLAPGRASFFASSTVRDPENCMSTPFRTEPSCPLKTMDKALNTWTTRTAPSSTGSNRISR